jgi:hypothetical protein
MINYIVKLTDVPVRGQNVEILDDLLSGQNIGGRNVMNKQGKLHYIGHSEVSL